ncbi:MAG: LbtU family siderophore porin [Desulfuromonadales bacterium]
MRKTLITLMFTSLLLVPALAFAQGDQPGAAGTDAASIESRLESLEARQAEIYHTLAEKKEAGLAEKITERISISGLLEVEAAAANVKFDDGSKDAASDLALATAQFGLGVKLTEMVSGDIIFLYEEGAFGDEDTDLEVDEAAINFEHGPWSARVGRQYVPFGVFYSHFISDPLTLELGETRETAVLAGYTYGPATLSAFVFNGDAEKSGNEDHLRDWGASLVIAPAEGIVLGGSFISDLADSDAELLSEYRRRVGGWSAFAIVGHGPFGFSAEALGAVKKFAASDLDEDGNGKGDQPLAWNLEASWAVRENVELALRFEGSDEFAGQPERQYGIDVSWSPWENTTLSLEYLRGGFDRDFAGDLVSSADSPADKRDLVTAQLAFEF